MVRGYMKMGNINSLVSGMETKVGGISIEPTKGVVDTLSMA